MELGRTLNFSFSGALRSRLWNWQHILLILLSAFDQAFVPPKKTKFRHFWGIATLLGSRSLALPGNALLPRLCLASLCERRANTWWNGRRNLQFSGFQGRALEPVGQLVAFAENCPKLWHFSAMLPGTSRPSFSARKIFLDFYSAHWHKPWLFCACCL